MVVFVLAHNVKNIASHHKYFIGSKATLFLQMSVWVKKLYQDN